MVLPSESFLSPGDAGPPVAVPPPPYFSPLRGIPTDVHRIPSNISPMLARGTVAQVAGIRYEVKAQRHLLDILGPLYSPSPAFHFSDNGFPRICIPDGLYEHRQNSVVFEIKYQHMPEAWWQLRKLYEPVIRERDRGSPARRVFPVEVCRTFDPGTPFPEPIQIIGDVEEFCLNPSGPFAVYVWRP